ncbi:MAG: sugar-binding protein, partial [candidate division Zixibacteria bacterium]
MSSQRPSLFFRFWLSVCCISNFASALGGMDINSRDVDTGAVDLNPLESFSLDSCEILLSTGQITFEEGRTIPFLYSNAVLENGCFSCYSTEPQKTVYRSTPLTIAGPYYGSAGGTTQYAEIDTLVVVYPHYRNMSVRMDLSTADIEILKAEVAKSKRFLWRSSNLKCLMNTGADCIVIDRTLTPAHLWDLYGGGRYWLTYWSIDGATSVEQDLYDAGIVDGQYSVVIVLYAFENSEGAVAAVGGAAYGVDIGFMGNTAYIAIPLAWGLDSLPITHEYLHALDSIYTSSGNPGGNDLFHADRPELFPYATDNGRHFNFLICNVLDPESWLQLDPQWARLSTAPDNDGDGVPDSGDLPITEETLGSLPTKTDTDDDGLSDLDELTAAFYSGSNPLLPDTDGDGLLDGNDPFPLYSYNDQISHGEPWIDGFIGEDEYVEVVSSYVRGNPDIGATIYATWSEGILYLAFDITDDNVETPYKGTFWAFNDNLEINIDSRQDGWGWSDDRNYRFCVVPMGSGGNPFVFGEYKSFVTGSKETHEIDVSTLSAKYALRPGGYIVEMAIPASLMPEVDVNSGSSMRLTFWVRDYDAYGDWPKFNIFTGMSGDVPGFVKV